MFSYKTNTNNYCIDVSKPYKITFNNTERGEGGELVLITFNNFKPLLIYSLKHMINKNTQNTNLSWKPNWVNHQYFLLFQNCYLQIVFSWCYKQWWYYTLFTSNYWKEATTPYFVSYNWQDATTTYLPASTGRRLQHPTGMFPSLVPPYHPDRFLVIFHISLPFNICHTHWYLLLFLWFGT